MTTIIVTNENDDVEKFDFDADTTEISIGRRSTNDVCIANLSVSGKHARITLDTTGALIEDLNSTNGTYINGRLISRQLLDGGDQIIIGKTRVQYQIEQTTEQPNKSQSEQAAELQPALTPEASQPATVTRLTGNGSNGRVTAPIPAPQLNGLNHNDFDDEPMTLSQKAKLALGGGRAQSRTPNNDHERDSDVALADPNQPDPVAPLTGKHHSPEQVEFDGAQKLTHDLDAPAIQTPAGAVIEIKNGAKSGQVLPIDKPVTTLGRPGIQIAAIMRKPDGYFLMHIESDDSVELPTLNRDEIGDEPVLLHSGDRLNVAGIEVEFMLS
ncbi:MAG: FHA domain-containing protein [Granulosicoccaceae bacterium]